MIEVSCPKCHGGRVRKQGTTVQGKQRLLWHAIEHRTGQILAYVWGFLMKILLF
jgi:hypothetical protein